MTKPLWDDDVPGIENGSGVRFVPTITAFLADKRNTDTAAVVVYPGGGYQMRADHERGPIALWLNSVGVSAFVVDYRVAPYRHPIPMLDGQRGIRHVRYHAEEYGINPAKIGVLGFSAGGHLASTVATHFDQGDPKSSDPVEGVSSRPDAVILCYPVITFGTWGHQGCMHNLLGESPSDELIESLSNETQVTEETPPTFLWHTAADEGVRVENSLLFAGALSTAGVPFALHVYPNGSHGLGLAREEPYTADWTRSCELWLRQIGF